VVVGDFVVVIVVVVVVNIGIVTVVVCGSRRACIVGLVFVVVVVIAVVNVIIIVLVLSPLSSLLSSVLSWSSSWLLLSLSFVANFDADLLLPHHCQYHINLTKLLLTYTTINIFIAYIH
jgi:hypothetical protein